MPHLSELHGAATHLAVIAIPVYVLVLLARRLGRGGDWLRHAEPWVVGAALAGTLLAGATGLLVWGQAQQTLRGSSLRVGTVHFWLGIALTLMTVVLVAWRFRRAQTDRHTHSVELLAGGVIALVAVFAQSYLGGRMTYNSAVGVASAGQLAESAAGATRAARAATARWPRAIAGRASPAAATSRSSAACTPTGCSRRRSSPIATSPRSTPTCERSGADARMPPHEPART
jgi:uncharacterized membrane protein